MLPGHGIVCKRLEVGVGMATVYKTVRPQKRAHAHVVETGGEQERPWIRRRHTRGIIPELRFRYSRLYDDPRRLAS